MFYGWEDWMASMQYAMPQEEASKWEKDEWRQSLKGRKNKEHEWAQVKEREKSLWAWWFRSSSLHSWDAPITLTPQHDENDFPWKAFESLNFNRLLRRSSWFKVAGKRVMRERERRAIRHEDDAMSRSSSYPCCTLKGSDEDPTISIW